MTSQRLLLNSLIKPLGVASATSLCASVLLFSAMPAQAVLFYRTGDTNYNTMPPTGSLTNSGWQYQGAWGGFSGTVISSNCFLTAQHMGGTVGDKFVFRGIEYSTIAFYDDPDTDLRICRISGLFSTNAPLYTKRNERGKSLVVIGRGTQRGAEIRVNKRLKGWQWGPFDDVQRWGQNTVSSIANGGPGKGELLRASFDAGAGRNEAHLSAGDSGGAVFIKDGRLYKLAGINYGVDGPYNTANSGTGFEAALFDQRGFYLQTSEGAWTLFPRTGKIAGAFYATRISSRIAWINSILSQPAR